MHLKANVGGHSMGAMHLDIVQGEQLGLVIKDVTLMLNHPPESEPLFPKARFGQDPLKLANRLTSIDAQTTRHTEARDLIH